MFFRTLWSEKTLIFLKDPTHLWVGFPALARNGIDDHIAEGAPDIVAAAAVAVAAAAPAAAVLWRRWGGYRRLIAGILLHGAGPDRRWRQRACDVTSSWCHNCRRCCCRCRRFVDRVVLQDALFRRLQITAVKNKNLLQGWTLVYKYSISVARKKPT